MGGQAHAFHAAGGDDGAFAGADLLRGQRDRAQAGAADLVDAERGLGVRQAGGAGGLAGRVLALAGGQDLAEISFVHIGRIEPARATWRPCSATAPSSWACMRARARR